jgi:ParB family chromosome partitioning protein
MNKKNQGEGVVREGIQRIGGLSGFAKTRSRRDSPFNFGGSVAVELPEEKESVTEVRVDDLVAGRFQPRKYFDAESLKDLSESIREHGILQPLVVRKVAEDQFELIAGERRMRAARLAGLKTVPVVIVEISDDKARQIALIENLQREDLNPIEETESLLELLAFELNVTKKQVVSLLYQLENAEKGRSEVERQIFEKVERLFAMIGNIKWQTFVRTRLPLLGLPVDIVEAVRNGSLSYTKAMAVNGVKDDNLRSQLLAEALTQGHSVRVLKQRAKELSAEKRVESMGSPRKSESSPLEKRFRHIFGMRAALPLLEGEAVEKVSALFDELELLLGSRLS